MPDESLDLQRLPTVLKLRKDLLDACLAEERRTRPKKPRTHPLMVLRRPWRAGPPLFAVIAALGISAVGITIDGAVAGPLWPTNEAGESYGSGDLSVEKYGLGPLTPAQGPDLVSAQGIGPHGEHVSGYIKETEREAANGSDVKTPAEALEWDHEQQAGKRTIPLYARDGTTVIGRFTIGDSADE